MPLDCEQVSEGWHDSSRLSRCLNADVTGPTRRQGDSSMSKTRSPQLNMDFPKQQQRQPLLKTYEFLYDDLYRNVECGVFMVCISRFKWIFWIQNFDFILILQPNFHQCLHSSVHCYIFLLLVPFCHRKEETVRDRDCVDWFSDLKIKNRHLEGYKFLKTYGYDAEDRLCMLLANPIEVKMSTQMSKHPPLTLSAGQVSFHSRLVDVC